MFKALSIVGELPDAQPLLATTSACVLPGPTKAPPARTRTATIAARLFIISAVPPRSQPLVPRRLPVWLLGAQRSGEGSGPARQVVAAKALHTHRHPSW